MSGKSLQRGDVSTVELMLPLPPDECVARLRIAVDPGGVFFGFGSKPVIGRVFRRWVCLRKRIGYRNSFQTFLIGRVEPHGEGSVFRGKADFTRSSWCSWRSGSAHSSAAA